MATRYSGDLKISVQLTDRDDYKVTISRAGRNVWRGVVGAPRSLTHSLDSPTAFDNAAKAGLSFADDDGADVQSADSTDSGWHVSRSARRTSGDTSRRKSRSARGWELWSLGDKDGPSEPHYIDSYKDKGEAERRMKRLKASHPYTRYTLKRRRVESKRMFGSRNRTRPMKRRMGRDQAVFPTKRQASHFTNLLHRHGQRNAIPAETRTGYAVIYPASTPDHVVTAAKREASTMNDRTRPRRKRKATSKKRTTRRRRRSSIRSRRTR